MFLISRIKANEQLLMDYKRKTTTATGSLRFIPFQDEITSITLSQPLGKNNHKFYK